MSTQTKDDPLLRIDPTYTGPNYQGFHFTLVSGSGKPTHTLTIITQANGELFTETASITGDWKGDGAAKSISGLITDNGCGIDCSWTTPNGKNELQGTLTYSSEGKLGQLQPSAYLNGNVTAYDPNGNVLPGMGPGQVSGEGYGPPPVGLDQ